jgi:phosphoribosylformylglycinamidine synthase
MCERLLANPLVEDYEIQDSPPREFGVIRFPAAATRSTPLQAAQRVGEARILWHQDTHLRGRDAVIVSRRLLLRRLPPVGAIARFAPIMGEVERFAAAAAWCSASATGFRSSARPAFLSGGLLPNLSLASSAAS